MPVFDQRNQKVTYQYNAAGNINFGRVKNTMELSNELNKLSAELDKAIESGAISRKIGMEAKYKLEKANIEIDETHPDKKSILQYLNEAKVLLQGITAATGLVKGILEAVKLAKVLFA